MEPSHLQVLRKAGIGNDELGMGNRFLALTLGWGTIKTNHVSRHFSVEPGNQLITNYQFPITNYQFPIPNSQLTI
jgi:hypothetical protein